MIWEIFSAAFYSFVKSEIISLCVLGVKVLVRDEEDAKDDFPLFNWTTSSTDLIHGSLY